MDEGSRNREQILGRFRRALKQWVCRQNEQPLTRWLAREMHSSGSLSRLPIADWHICRQELREARRSRPGWPAEWDDAAVKLVIATLRYSRPDGSPAGDFGERGSTRPPEKVVREWLTALEGSAAAEYLRRWQKSRKRDVEFSPEVPAWDVSPGVLSVLRDQTTGGGDFVAVDHRKSGLPFRFELFGSGRSWLGPSWVIEGEPGA